MVLLTAFSGVSFHFRRMTHAYTGKCSFSQLNDVVLSLSAISPPGHPLEAAAVPFAALFDCSEDVPFPEISHGGHIERLYRFLNDYEAKERNVTLFTELRNAENEGQVSEILAGDLIKPLAGDFIVGKGTYAGWKKKQERVTIMTLGLGQPEIWHGYLDLVAVPLALQSQSTVPVSVASVDDDQLSSKAGDQQSSDSEDDENCCVEVKRGKVSKFVQQIIGETVCFSFVLRNKNKNKHLTKSMVPGLIISSSQFLVVLYDCENDVLLVSDIITWAKGGVVHRAGIIALWAVLHHGKYLKELDPRFIHENGLRSSFHEFAKSQHVFETYEKLSSYEHANVSSKDDHSLEDMPYCYFMPPAAVKRAFWYSAEEDSPPKKSKST